MRSVTNDHRRGVGKAVIEQGKKTMNHDMASVRCMALGLRNYVPSATLADPRERHDVRAR